MHLVDTDRAKGTCMDWLAGLRPRLQSVGRQGGFTYLDMDESLQTGWKAAGVLAGQDADAEIVQDAGYLWDARRQVVDRAPWLSPGPPRGDRRPLIAVVGLGAWGSRHVPTLVELVGADGVVGSTHPACAPRPRRSGCGRWRHRPARAGGRRRRGGDADPDARRDRDRAAARGLHLLVEKPLATTVADAGELVELARPGARPHGRPRLPVPAPTSGRGPARRARPAAPAGRRAPHTRAGQARVGRLGELALHEIAVALDLGALRGPVSTAAFLPWSVTGIGYEDGAFAWFSSDGGTVEIACSWLSAVRSRRLWRGGRGGQRCWSTTAHPAARRLGRPSHLDPGPARAAGLGGVLGPACPAGAGGVPARRAGPRGAATGSPRRPTGCCLACAWSSR